MRRWRAGSSRCSSPSRRSRTRSRSCAASRRSTSCITACASPTPRSWRPRRSSNRYISDRFLPDKAIDLMDEAASRIRMQVDSKPEELDELDRRIIQLKIEREALKKESDQASRDRLERLEKELARARAEVGGADGAVEVGQGQARRFAEDQGAARQGALRARDRAAQGRARPGGRAGLRRDPRPREEAQGSREPRGRRAARA